MERNWSNQNQREEKIQKGEQEKENLKIKDDEKSVRAKAEIFEEKKERGEE